MEERLHNYVEVNRLLEIPPQHMLIDAAAHLRRLCQSISRSRADCKGIELIVQDSVQLDSERCWRLSVIVFELVTNFAHAFGAGGGTIRVELLPRGPVVQCRVEGNWTTAEEIRLGRVSTIVEALVASLDGTINQYFGPRAAVSNLIFPPFARSRKQNELATSGAPKSLSPNPLSD